MNDDTRTLDLLRRLRQVLYKNIQSLEFDTWLSLLTDTHDEIQRLEALETPVAVRTSPLLPLEQAAGRMP